MKTTNKIIKSIDINSPAKKARLKQGDIIETINGEPVLDFIDENYFNSLSELEIAFLRNGKNHTTSMAKDALEPLGIEYEENMYPADRQCVNNCLFCFVDQLPKGMRESLYIKDDDWRYSVLFGNYVTLTNISDKELERIVKRQASPLYISVHAIDGEARNNLMLSKKADKIKQQLNYLAENNIIMHTQVVLCPGINDGKILDETIEYLHGLYPYVRSLAVVPVGLTGHRDNLPELKAVDEDKAREIIGTIEKYNQIYQRESGINFVFASDEFYSKANLLYPMFETGEHYPQLSNGVGMFSELKSEFNDALKTYEEEIANIDSDIKIVSVTGVSAYHEIKSTMDTVIGRAENLNVNVVKIINKHFGDSITVAGLLCGADIVNQLKNIECDVIIVPASTLKDGGNVFLDNTDIEYVEQSLGVKAIIQDIDGYAMIESIIEGAAKG